MTSRSALLQKDIESALAIANRGSPSMQAVRGAVLKRLTKDLQFINRLPGRLANMSEASLRELIAMWRERNNQEAAIRMKISHLRHVYKAYLSNYDFPDNQSLGLNRIANTERPITITNLSVQRISLPLAKIICSLQYQFGLKLSEAISLQSFMYYEGRLHIHRQVAHNGVERQITVESESAHELLLSTIKAYPKGFLHHYRNQHFVTKLIKAELGKVGIYHKENFRHLYVLRRYSELIELRSETAALRQLRYELGYARNHEVKQILRGKLIDES